MVAINERSKASLQKYERVKDIVIAYNKNYYKCPDFTITKINGAYIYNLESFMKFESCYNDKIGIKNNSVVKYFKNLKTMDGKKIKKLHIKDLNQELLLFPLYNLQKTEITENYGPGIYVEQKAIGFIACYEIKVVSFDIDNLQFNLLQFNDKQLLQKPSYQNKKVVFRKKETLLIYQNSFEIP